MKNSRNKRIVGNNTASYNDKHPTNPIIFGPIRKAIRLVRNAKIKRKIRACANLPKQTLIAAVNDILHSSGRQT